MAQRGYDAYYLPPVPVPVGGRHAGDFLDNGAIRTLFVAGLPDDVKAREIHNLFRRRPGFDSCQLKYTGRGNQVVAFATFFNHQSAIAAMHSLNGVKFDPQTNSTLHIELAKTNSRRKSGAGSGPYVVIDNRPKDKSNERATSSNEGDDESEEEAPSEYEDPSEEEDPSEDEDPSKEEDGNCGSNSDLVKSETAGNGSTMAGGDSVPRAGNEAVNGDNKPCSTLFIANLGPSCSMEELEQVFSQYPGFVALRMRRGGTPLAFADFEEIKQATKAMEGLQGTLLASSDIKGMSIEYARSKMRKQAPQQGHRFTLRI
ncbi:hypothetical protein MLD38_007900 [Melastoma candidum]|uniref:Uncharacterized protein n=1 Tax=Melastoma candidum TaxID=119954 RepID=A0ACB9RT53_9MYRT|nr:hypothetical protein MLD38_007900 [Melastoma candidum]